MYIPKANMGYGYNNKKTPAKKIIIFSGAGLSQPSGISTFRDSNGLWENHQIEEICNESTWKKNFDAVHKFYNQRRVQLNDIKPNRAHEAVARIMKKYGEDNVYNITQNVDDLFERTGCEVLHLHGELTKMHCEACGETWEIGYHKFNSKMDRCPKCNSLKGVRPKIVFFGGAAPMYSYFSRAMDYANNPETIVLVIGTMGNVVPIWSYLQGKTCKKVLCNMEPSKSIPDDKFDKVYYESIETAINQIEKYIEDTWENK